MSRSVTLVVTLSLLLFGHGSSVSAASSFAGTEGTAIPTVVRELCVGDCAGLRPTPDRGDGAAFDFALGVQGLLDGFDLTVETEGNVFILGPIRADGDITLVADQIGFFETEIDTGGDVLVSNPGFPPISPPRLPPLRFPPGDGIIITANVSVVTLPEIGHIEPGNSEAGSIRIGSGGELRLSGAGLSSTRVAQAVAAVGSIASAPITLTAGSTTPQIVYDLGSDGDVYLDLSGVTLANLDVRAGAFLLAVGESAMPTPEPGTALFLALGLAGLATGGRRT